MDNINIWFARNKDGNIVTIDKINENNRYEEYSCPICESKLIAKLGEKNAHHLAHKDASKCSRETQIHFFVKNELLKQGDKFTVKLDDESKEFICKEILIEQEYKTEFGTYNPDITIITEDDKTIYFEVAHTNKKKIEDYIDIWAELNNIVVEIETKEMIEGRIIKEFDAKFYEGKCFNIRQEDKEYYDLVGKIKLNKSNYPIEEINKLDWLWRDINKYLLGEIEISELSDEIQSIENEKLRKVVVNILRKNRCSGVMKEYIKYNIDKIKHELKGYVNEKIEIPRLVYDRIYVGYDIILKHNIRVTYSLTKKYDYINFIKIYECCNKLASKYNTSEYSIYLHTSNMNVYFNCNYNDKRKTIYINTLDYDYIENCILNMIDDFLKFKNNLKINSNLKRKYNILLCNKVLKLFRNRYNVSFSGDYITVRDSYKNTFDIAYRMNYKNYKNIKTLYADVENYLKIEINKLDLKYNDNDIKLINIKRSIERNINFIYGWDLINCYNKEDHIFISFGRKFYKRERYKNRYIEVLKHKNIININIYYDYFKYGLDYVCNKTNQILKNEIDECEKDLKRTNINNPIILKYKSKLDILRDRKFEYFNEILKYRFLNNEDLSLINNRIIFIDNKLNMIPINFIKINKLKDRKKFIKCLIKNSSIRKNKKIDKELKSYITTNLVKYYDHNYDKCKIQVENNILNGCFKIVIEKYCENIYFEYLIKRHNGKIFIINKNKYLGDQLELKTEIENDIRQKIYKL